MINIFSTQFHKDLKDNVSKQYLELIEDIRQEIKEGLSSDYLSTSFVDDFGQIIFDEKLNTYSPLKFYWTHLLNDLIYLVELHEEAEESTLVEEEIFSYWEHSDFAEAFFVFLDEGKSIADISSSFLPLIENQILAYYFLHIGDNSTKIPLVYTVIPEIGDFNSRLYLTDKHNFIVPPGTPDSFPSVPLMEIGPSSISFNLNEEVIKEEVQKGTFEISKDLYLLPSNVEGIKRFDEFENSIDRALKIIKEASPNSYNTFKSFTHSIVPIDELGIVSYSMQFLPGYSSINMFDRDFVDLMDDLLHENGHHYLNTFLNFTDLINEDDEKIYYSPWRKALRPIRGIYHATFTFFWALKQNGDLLEIDLTTKKKKKIKTRFVEEYYMLNYCYPDLLHAFSANKINKDGMEVMEEIYDRIRSFDDKIEKVLSSLKDSSALLNLKKDLEEKRNKYVLS